MKKIILYVASAVAMLFFGCKQIPSVETMETTAIAVGKAAAYVANQTKIDDKSRAVVIEVMTKASEVVPSADQTFVDAWTPIAKEVTDKLVKEGKLDEAQAVLVNSAFAVACKGLDYLVTVRFPKAKQYENLMSAAVKGFTSGFLSVFKPVNGVVSVPAEDYDKEAYDFLMATEVLK